MAPVFVALLLLWIGVRYPQYLDNVYQLLGRIVTPFQQVVDAPFRFQEAMRSFLRDKSTLIQENTQLQRQQIYLQAQIQKLQSLEAENLELRELLKSIGNDLESYSEARMIQVETDPFRQQIVLNKGRDSGVEVGQPVIDPQGLVGVVLSTQNDTSRVLLLTDAEFAVPVQSVRSKERAIAMGSGVGGEIRLSYVPTTADFVEGDALVTSGIGGGFPAGTPVGVITSIQHDPGTRFSLISARPHAKFGQFKHVLLVKPVNRQALEQAASSQNPQTGGV